MWDVHQRARRGIRLLVGRQAVLQLLAIGGGIVVARGLGPEPLGVFGIALFVVGVLALVADLGMRTVLIRRAAPVTELELGTCFTVQQGLVTALVALLVMAAPAVATLYGQAPGELAWLLRLLALDLYLRSWRGMSEVRLERELRYRELAVADVVGSVGYQAVAIGLVLAGWGVESLAWAVLTGNVLRTALLYHASPWPVRLVLYPPAVRELVDDQTSNPPFGTNLTYALERYVRVHQTSGTSGSPLRWLDTQESWEWWARCWGFVLRGAGVGPADRVFFPFSFGLFIGFWAGFEGARALGALAIPGGGQDSPTRLAWMAALGATVLVCTPSYALHLAEVARERGIDLSKLPVRITVHAGEPGAGIPSVRARIEDGWGARAFDHGGMTEMGAYGYECAQQAGLHVNESEFIVEVIDPATAAPARDGELVLTNLGRVGSPVVRYRTGDHVRLAEAPCPCSRTFSRLEGGILGRLDDMLIVRGVNVFPAAIEGVVRRFPAIDEFQIEVFRAGELDEVRVLVEVGDAAGASRLQEALRTSLGIRLEVAPVPLRSLPRYELKARRVVRR